MSWKGVKKTISRLPHQLKTRNGGDDVTQDLDYLVLEKKYKEYVHSVNELCIEVKTYRDNLASMLNCQSQNATLLAEVCGLQSESDFDYNSMSPKMKQALEDYATAMTYCRQENMSLLDDLDASVIQPLDQYQMITRTIDKTIVKRQHKLIDFDRHRISYLKYSSISEPTPSEEKHMFKLQTQYDNAAHEYDYFNTMLKEELAYFLDMTLDFIEPIIQVFYDIQCRILGGLYGRLHEVIQHNGPNFPTLDLSIEEGYMQRIEERNVTEELDMIDLFKKGLKPWESRRDSIGSRRTSYQREEDDNYLSVQNNLPPINRSRSNSSIASDAIDRRLSSSYSTIRRDRSLSSPVTKQPPPLSPRPSFLTQRNSNYVSSSHKVAQLPARPPRQELSSTTLPRTYTINQQQSLKKTLSDNNRPSPGYELKKTISSGSISTISTPSAPVTPPVTNEELGSTYQRLRQSTPNPSVSPFLDQQKEDRSSLVKKKRAPPPPPPPSKRTPAGMNNKKEYVEALYDLNAPQDGDLSFRMGDIIEIIEKTEQSQDWWKGRLRDQIGMFPANYVKQL
ncbi:uncharacterized protein BX663DRAFT_484182 [Cokeromyces recurvatus]|uniref:uncharacterized protein n=1 Tax=Cokeromyces recurvatus TaxID=90255 RepID=UPI0022206497|nr:uncharacterized protein BX663DRAFT_484182 [Cokeromyces recurvatus]KAI7905714.1 hypothetical protein BX663DRAFT_484182 [Cokeromyces recurvatus]